MISPLNERPILPEERKNGNEGIQKTPALRPGQFRANSSGISRFPFSVFFQLNSRRNRIVAAAGDLYVAKSKRFF
jgi:hypothetical protein